jgi:hypothetical protein
MMSISVHSSYFGGVMGEMGQVKSKIIVIHSMRDIVMLLSMFAYYNEYKESTSTATP